MLTPYFTKEEYEVQKNHLPKVKGITDTAFGILKASWATILLVVKAASMFRTQSTNTPKRLYKLKIKRWLKKQYGNCLKSLST